MDLSLWEPPDAGYYSSNESNYNVGDVVNLVYKPDVIEDEFLNERSCLQVLKIWMDKADEEIIKLEEDISMLKCQLEHDDMDWFEPCTAVLRERINHLDILIQSLESDISEDVQSLAFQTLSKQPGKNFAPTLHELLKPLLDKDHLVESSQTEDAITSKHIADIHTRVTDKSGEDSGKLNEVNENLVPNSAHVESCMFNSVRAGLHDATVKASTASTASSGGVEIKTTDEEVLLKTKAVRPMLEHEEKHKIADAKCRLVKSKKPRSTAHLQQKHETLKVNQEAKPISAPTTVVKKEDPSGMDCNSSSTTVRKSQGTKNVGKYTVNDLRTIAKNNKLPGYYRLRKKELLELLGLEEEILDSREQRLPKEEVSLAYNR